MHCATLSTLVKKVEVDENGWLGWKLFALVLGTTAADGVAVVVVERRRRHDQNTLLVHFVPIILAVNMLNKAIFGPLQHCL